MNKNVDSFIMCLYKQGRIVHASLMWNDGEVI